MGGKGHLEYSEEKGNAAQHSPESLFDFIFATFEHKNPSQSTELCVRHSQILGASLE